ncbi:MAG: signal peptide peptidase SppA [Verrucomicrobia bacterium]|nr:signal peptide peptidase SppA [Verrucomicrobiota bacterium]
MDTPKSRSLLSRLAGGLDGSRRLAANLLFLVLLGVLFAAWFSGGPKVPSSGALVLNPKGTLVEQLTASSPRGLIDSIVSGPNEETLLKDLLDAISAAKDDKRINSIYLDLTQLENAGMTKLQDLRAALLDFRKAGKKVIAYADSYTQVPYYIAAAADEVWMHQMGAVLLEGLGRWRTYYKDGLDRLEVEVNVVRVGEYKSAGEVYFRNEPSPEAREADSKFLNDLWTTWLNDVAASRKLKAEDVKGYIHNLPERLKAAKGDTAKLALEAKLVDKLGQRDDIRARMIALAGEDKDEKKEKTFAKVTYKDYLQARGGDRTGASGSGDAVAVVVAKGTILDGKQPAGNIGGDSTAKLIRQAREDSKVKAIVLRVDSPGGSAFASEVIRRELELARKAGKKVVVSMGTLAASGGYWISTSADEIWASPDTITGSIGIFGIFPNVTKSMQKFLGVRVDGVGTTPLSGALRPDRPMSPELLSVLQVAINRGYEEFLERVAEARKMSRDEVDKLARGRVWSGADAFRLKLVDKLGGLNEAIASAAKLSGLPSGHRTWWVEEKKSFGQRLLSGLFSAQTRFARAFGVELADDEPARPAPAVQALQRELRSLEALSKLNDPNGAYALFADDLR